MGIRKQSCTHRRCLRPKGVDVVAKQQADPNGDAGVGMRCHEVCVASPQTSYVKSNLEHVPRMLHGLPSPAERDAAFWAAVEGLMGVQASRPPTSASAAGGSAAAPSAAESAASCSPPSNEEPENAPLRSIPAQVLQYRPTPSQNGASSQNGVSSQNETPQFFSPPKPLMVSSAAPKAYYPTQECKVHASPQQQNHSLSQASSELRVLSCVGGSCVGGSCVGTTKTNATAAADALLGADRESTPRRHSNKRLRSVRCGTCDACSLFDCGACKNCLDKPKFGGPGCRKQACLRRNCRRLRLVEDDGPEGAEGAEEGATQGATHSSDDEEPPARRPAHFAQRALSALDALGALSSRGSLGAAPAGAALPDAHSLTSPTSKHLSRLSTPVSLLSPATTVMMPLTEGTGQGLLVPRHQPHQQQLAQLLLQKSPKLDTLRSVASGLGLGAVAEHVPATSSLGLGAPPQPIAAALSSFSFEKASFEPRCAERLAQA